ncbi:hypothetical protein KAU32_04875 [bacterium]|nr:hypothetical protein [bacterium]
MKCALVLIVLLSSLVCFSQALELSDRDFSLDDIRPLHIGLLTGGSHLVKMMSNRFFLSIGFTKMEAKYYSIFTGLVVMIATELIINSSNSGTQRENSLIGMGIYLVSVRF